VSSASVISDLGRADDVEAAAVVEAGGEELPVEGGGIGGGLGAEDVAAAEDDEEGAVFGEVDRADFRRDAGGELDVLDLVAVVEFDGLKRLNRQGAEDAEFEKGGGHGGKCRERVPGDQ
jgi:hypothetical protein